MWKCRFARKLSTTRGNNLAVDHEFEAIRACKFDGQDIADVLSQLLRKPVIPCTSILRMGLLKEHTAYVQPKGVGSLLCATWYVRARYINGL